MNFRRGMVRLWAVLTVVWVTLIGGTFYQFALSTMRSTSSFAGVWDVLDEQLVLILALALAPPLAVFVAGAIAF